MRKYFNFGSLPIKAITEYVSEVSGQPIPLELSLNNLSVEVDHTFGVCILQPNKIYTALTEVMLSAEDMSKIGYDYIPNTLLSALCIRPNLFAIPMENGENFMLAYSFTVHQNIKININNIDFGNVVFEYDDENKPPFIQNIENKMSEMQNELKPDEENDAPINEDREFDVENDLKKLDEAIDNHKKHLEEEEKMKELSSNSLRDIFDKAANELLEGGEEVAVNTEGEE